MTTIVGNRGQLWTSTLSPHLESPHLDYRVGIEGCSQNARDFRESLRGWPFHSESVSLEGAPSSVAATPSIGVFSITENPQEDPTCSKHAESEREGFQRFLRGFERFSEVLRGFQRF